MADVHVSDLTVGYYCYHNHRISGMERKKNGSTQNERRMVVLKFSQKTTKLLMG